VAIKSAPTRVGPYIFVAGRPFLLENGTSVRQVAELLGDTEDIVRKHYSKWVPGRQDRVRSGLQAAFKNIPGPLEPRIPGRAQVIEMQPAVNE
jgi:hypothetical protein